MKQIILILLVSVCMADWNIVTMSMYSNGTIKQVQFKTPKVKVSCAVLHLDANGNQTACPGYAQ